MISRSTAPRMLATVALLACAAALPGCFWLGGTAGSGDAATEARTVAAFSEIDVGGDYELVVVIGPDQHLEVTADDNILPLIETTVRDGELKIRSSESIRPKVRPVLTITVPSLVGIDSSGATKVNAAGLTGERFELDTSGASNVVLSGAVKNLTVDVSGAANIDAAGLQAEVATVDVSGAAKVDVTVSKTLDVEVSGAGKVAYAGDPVVSKDISGAGKVVRR